MKLSWIAWEFSNETIGLTRTPWRKGEQ